MAVSVVQDAQLPRRVESRHIDYIPAESPFVSQPEFTGPLVRTLGGADISWLAGWFAAAIAYLLLAALAPGTARHDRQLAATALLARPRLGAATRSAARSSA